MQGADVSHPTFRTDVCGEGHLDQVRESFVVEPQQAKISTQVQKGRRQWG